MANPAALRRIVTERRVVQQADLQAESLTPVGQGMQVPARFRQCLGA